MSAAPSAPRRTKLDLALEHARAGRPVFPCHPPLPDGRCACGNPKCDSPGKHPIGRLVPNGLKQATTDEATIRRWWMQAPKANIGIPTGRVSGFIVLDVDPRHGGDDSLFELERRHGRLPNTPEARTGSDGRHILFDCQDSLVANKVGIAPGLDIRGDGGYIIAAGSVHACGGVYEWDAGYHPDDTPLAPMPGWLLDACCHNGGRGASAAVDVADVLAGVPEGGRDQALFSAVLACHRARVPEAWALRLALEAAANCTPPYPAEKAREKVARLYNSYVAPPAPEVGDLDDPSGDCPRCARFRATIDQLNATLTKEREERSLHFSVLKNPGLPPAKRLTYLAAVHLHESDAKGGKADPDGWTKAPSAALAEAAGLPESTAARNLKQLAEDGLLEVAKQVKTERAIDRESGEIKETPVTVNGRPVEMFVVRAPARDLRTAYRAGATAASERKRPGGNHPRCPEHPDAEPVEEITTIERTTVKCSICLRALKQTERTIGHRKGESGRHNDDRDAEVGEGLTKLYQRARGEAAPPPESAPGHHNGALGTPTLSHHNGGRPSARPRGQDAGGRWKALALCLGCGEPLQPGRTYYCPGCTAKHAAGGAA